MRPGTAGKGCLTMTRLGDYLLQISVGEALAANERPCLW